VVAVATVAAAGAGAAEVAAAVDSLAAELAAADSSGAEVAVAVAAAGSVAGSSSVRAVWPARAAPVVRDAAYPGARAASAKSAELGQSREPVEAIARPDSSSTRRGTLVDCCSIATTASGG
jgi:hypothetical protein